MKVTESRVGEKFDIDEQAARSGTKTGEPYGSKRDIAQMAEHGGPDDPHHVRLKGRVAYGYMLWSTASDCHDGRIVLDVDSPGSKAWWANVKNP